MRCVKVKDNIEVTKKIKNKKKIAIGQSMVIIETEREKEE